MMVELARVTVGGVLVAALVAGAAGCGGRDSGAESSPDDLPAEPTTIATTAASPTTVADPGRTYRLTKPLCGMVDVTPLADVFPIDSGEPLADTVKLCETGRLSDTMTVGLSVNATLLPDAKWAKEYVQTGRQLARGTPTDLPGVGADAFWTGDEHRVKLLTCDGNLALNIQVETVSSAHRLPEGMPERLGRLAVGTFARLAR